MPIDLHPAALRLTNLVVGVSKSQLAAPTPCPDYTVGDLVEHIGTFAIAFTAVARKDLAALQGRPGPGNAANLKPDWQTCIPEDLVGLADAWNDPDAWTGVTRVGSGDTPGEVAGQIGLEELVVHGWDLARSSGQTFTCDDATLAFARDALLLFVKPGEEAAPGSPFGTVIEVPTDAPLLDQVIGLSGRDPSWSPS